jgi:NitT/TauT family transport system substrate-binding protein
VGEPPPEITRIRVPRTYFACNTPFLFAEELLHEEGFTDVELVTAELHYDFFGKVADGVIDLAYLFMPETTYAIDQGLPLLILGPANAGCTQIWATEDIVGMGDLRGKRLGIGPIRSEHPAHYAFITSILQWVGIEAGKDVELVTVNGSHVLTALGKEVDAVWTWSPQTLTLATTRGSHVIFDSFAEDPWRQYSCCGIIARKEFVEEYPVATRRALRAIYQALDLSHNNPDLAVDRSIQKGWILTEDYARSSFAQLSFDTWRRYDPEDSLRFYGLFMHEAGLIKSTPEEIIQKGTDLTFFNELKQELAYAPGGRDSQFSFYCDPETSQPQRTALRAAEGPRRTT